MVGESDAEDGAGGGAARYSGPEVIPEAVGTLSTLAEGAAATLAASDKSQTPAPSAVYPTFWAETTVDRWFSIEIVGTSAASEYWDDLVRAREALKIRLSSSPVNLVDETVEKWFSDEITTLPVASAHLNMLILARESLKSLLHIN